MKKMAIVPFKLLEEMNRWKVEQRPKLPPNPQVTQTSDLQKEMMSVLQKDNISESEKAQLFGQTLQKFQFAHNKAMKPETKHIHQPPSSIDETQTSKTINARIVGSVPVTLQRKAKLLLQMLEDHPSMSWNEQGNLEVNGKPISGSNIIDLVNDVLRQRKSSPPKGWEHFSRGLKDINVPQEYVGNKQRWSWMQRHTSDDSAEEDGDEYFETSSYLPPSPPPKSIKHEPIAAGSHSWEPY